MATGGRWVPTILILAGSLLLGLVIVFAGVVQRIAGGVGLRLAGRVTRVARRIVLARMLRWAIFLIGHEVHSFG